MGKKKFFPNGHLSFIKDTNLRVQFAKHLKWFPEHLKVYDKDNAKVVPFLLTPIQERLEFIKWNRMRRKLPVFIIILKARQVRASTWTEGTFFRDAIEIGNRRTVVMAHDDKTTREMLSRTRFFYDSYVEKNALETVNDSAATLKFKENNSEFVIYTAGSRERTARGFAGHAVHFAELDYYEDGEGAFVAAMQTISDSYPTVVVVECTAKQPGGMLEKLWTAAIEGQNEFIPIFFPWFSFEHYVRPVTFEDVARWSPKEWKERNASFLTATGYTALRARGGKDVEHGSTERAGTLQGAPGGESGGAGSRSEDRRPEGVSSQEDDLRDRGLLEEKGSLPGGSVRGVLPINQRVTEKDRRRGIYVPASRDLGTIRETGRDPGLWRRRPADGDGGAASAYRLELLESPLNALSDSLTEYEKGLIEEFDLPLERINWLRYCLHHRCASDEVRRRREFPSRPEEAFEATASEILDSYVIAKWEKEAKALEPRRVRFILKETEKGWKSTPEQDDEGYTLLFEPPDVKRRYVAALDPSEGFAHSDWQVCTVLDLDSGDQVAEFRARLEPQIAVDQVEGLCLYYNNAFLAVEVQGGGRSFQRHLALRGTIPLYERETFDRVGGISYPVKKGGWVTTEDNRKDLFSELRTSVREERCRIRSLVTLIECRTLWEKQIGDYRGRIEARPGKHDDGVMAHGIALLIRNKFVKDQTVEEVTERKANHIVMGLIERNRKIEAKKGHFGVKIPTKTIVVSAPSRLVDKRRSVL